MSNETRTHKQQLFLQVVQKMVMVIRGQLLMMKHNEL